ncbi:MAG: FAD-dependent oxidoreductase [Candidatus Omnitrophota bacterium]|nr:MAG: FAD-dependent oxidoreductase [Candidatus Omnitrophota bacterium]
MIRVVIIGGGFAGVSALKALSRHQLGLETLLIDRKQTFDFLPALPDTLSERIQPFSLICSLENVARRHGAQFINAEAGGIDFAKRAVHTSSHAYPYDYLILASGSETNFYGSKDIQQYAYALDSANDAERIHKALSRNSFDTVVIGGGGYTGVEIATNVRRYCIKNKRAKRIVIVERAPKLLGALSEWMKRYVSQNLKRMEIDVFLDTVVEKVDKGGVFLSNGKAFERTLFIWSAGVKTSDYLFDLNVEKTPQGRISVNDTLSVTENCFAAGDVVNFSWKGMPLRMCVQFALVQGRLAAENVICSLRGAPLKKYTPFDLGYIVPMANNHSCGRILGFNMKGLLPTMLHYVMCIYRSCGWRKKVGIIKNLMSS